MRLLIYIVLCMAPTVISCSRSSNNDYPLNDKTPQINDLLKNINIIPPEFKYNLASQDAENYYKAQKADSLYFPEYISVIGYLPDTSNYYSILYLEPGDDLYPSLKIFSKSGKLLASESISYADCSSGDCEIDSCLSVIRIINEVTLERSMRVKKTKCDSAGSKIPGETTTIEKSQIITLKTPGSIKFEPEKTN